nr:MAG TPA: hypothetical protein [Caudoviricetes sp.]
MKKIVISVEDNYKPRNGDVIVYNKEKDFFEIISKEEFLASIKKELKNINIRIDNVNEKADKNIENIGNLAKIIKENIK